MPVAVVTRVHTSVAVGFAALAVSAAVALPAGAQAASSSAAAPSSAKSTTVATTAGKAAKKRCRRGKVAVRKGGKVRCVRKRRVRGDDLRDGGSRQNQTGTGEQISTTAPAAPADEPSVPEQMQSANPHTEPPANQSQRADWTIVDAYGNAVDHSTLYPTYTLVGGAPVYYRQSCSDWWWENGWAIRRCWSNSNKTHYSRYEWDFWNGYGWQMYATRECVAGVCG